MEAEVLVEVQEEALSGVVLLEEVHQEVDFLEEFLLEVQVEVLAAEMIIEESIIITDILVHSILVEEQLLFQLGNKAFFQCSSCL